MHWPAPLVGFSAIRGASTVPPQLHLRSILVRYPRHTHKSICTLARNQRGIRLGFYPHDRPFECQAEYFNYPPISRSHSSSLIPITASVPRATILPRILAILAWKSRAACCSSALSSVSAIASRVAPSICAARSIRYSRKALRSCAVSSVADCNRLSI